MRVQTHLQHVELWKQLQEEALSDGVVLENGTVVLSDTTGATFTSGNVINVSNERNVRRKQDEEQRRTNQLTSLQRLQERKNIAAVRTAVRAERLNEVDQLRQHRQVTADQREEAVLKQLRSRRESRRNPADNTRLERHRRARLSVPSYRRQKFAQILCSKQF